MLNRNFHFAFPAPDQYTPQLRPFAIFPAFVSTPELRACPAKGFGGTKTKIFPISKQFLGHSSLNLLRHPDWFLLLAKLTRLAAAMPPSGAACFRAGAASDGSLPTMSL